MKKLLLFVLALNALLSHAQSSGDYRSFATGNWNVAATWEHYDGVAWQPAVAAPASTDGIITIRSPHTVTISSGINADQVIINAGGTLSDIALLILADGAGTDLICNGTFLLSNMLNGAGSAQINTTMTWSAGTMTAPLTIEPTGTLNLTTTNTKTISNVLVNSGTMVWNNGILNMSSGTFANSGTLNNSFDGTISSSGGSNVFTNSGIFIKTAGTGTTSININTQNTGILKGVGTLNFGSTFTNNGTIAPGLSPGAITVTSSSPVFTANSNLDIELLNGSGPGTGHDQLTTGSAALNGNLTLTELGTVPAGTYTIITSTGTLTGTFSSVTQPGGYTVIYNSNSVVVTRSAILPINLVTFSASSQAAGIEVKWQTATEQNTNRFIIERSADGVAFIAIGTVSATGNSNTAMSYLFTDQQPLQNISYYRLKSLDYDGFFAYSKIVEVSNKVAVAALSVYPNPVADRLMITGLKQGENHTIQLIDANGRIVLRTKTKNAQLSVDMSTRMHGSYWVKIITAGDAVIYKIIKP